MRPRLSRTHTPVYALEMVANEHTHKKKYTTLLLRALFPFSARMSSCSRCNSLCYIREVVCAFVFWLMLDPDKDDYLQSYVAAMAGWRIVVSDVEGAVKQRAGSGWLYRKICEGLWALNWKTSKSSNFAIKCVLVGKSF